MTRGGTGRGKGGKWEEERERRREREREGRGRTLHPSAPLPAHLPSLPTGPHRPSPALTGCRAVLPVASVALVQGAPLVPGVELSAIMEYLPLVPEREDAAAAWGVGGSKPVASLGHHCWPLGAAPAPPGLPTPPVSLSVGP